MLRELPVNCRTRVAALAKVVMSLASRIGIGTVAHGVSNVEQVRSVHIGCDQVQGV